MEISEMKFTCPALHNLGKDGSLEASVDEGNHIVYDKMGSEIYFDNIFNMQTKKGRSGRGGKGGLNTKPIFLIR